jgi:hypothetical protein
VTTAKSLVCQGDMFAGWQLYPKVFIAYLVAGISFDFLEGAGITSS